MSKGVIIIGLGQIGMGYDLHLDPALHVYSHARSFSQHPEFHLMAAVDPDGHSRNIFIQTYQTPAYSNLDAALSQHQPDVVVIATPTQFHSEILYEILENIRPMVILCEKPLSYVLDDARKMVQKCRDKGVLLYVNYMRRSDPGAIKVKGMFDSGMIQTPVKGVSWYSKGLIHNGSHFFNLLEFWLGSMKSSDLIERGRKWGEDDYEPDVRVKFERGTVIFLAAWEENFSHYAVELLSPSGRIRYEQEGSMIQWQHIEDNSVFKGYRGLSLQLDEISSGMSFSQLNVVEQLAKVLNGKEANICSGKEALETLSSIQTIIEKI